MQIAITISATIMPFLKSRLIIDRVNIRLSEIARAYDTYSIIAKGYGSRDRKMSRGLIP
jgi:hypothetical protein